MHALVLRAAAAGRPASSSITAPPLPCAGEDEEGQGFVWIARRARKRVCQPRQCSEPPPPVSWLATLRWKELGGKPGWWVAVSGGCGAGCGQLRLAAAGAAAAYNRQRHWSMQCAVCPHATRAPPFPPLCLQAQALFVLGSILFLCASAQLVYSVAYPAQQPPGLGSLSAALVGWPEVIACWLLFTPGALLQVGSVRH